MGANSAGLGPGAHPPRWTRYDRNTSSMLASNSPVIPPNLSTPIPMFLRFNILYWASNCRAGKPECTGATSSLPYPVQLFSASCTARTHGCGSLEGPCWLLPFLTQASLNTLPCSGSMVSLLRSHLLEVRASCTASTPPMTSPVVWSTFSNMTPHSFLWSLSGYLPNHL